MSNSIAALFSSTKQQNIAIESSIQNIKDTNSIDEQKIFYHQQNGNIIITINYFLFYIYYFLVIGIAFILLFRQKNVSILIRLIILVSFIFYPFIIGYIEQILFSIFNFCYAIINGNVYYNNDY